MSFIVLSALNMATSVASARYSTVQRETATLQIFACPSEEERRNITECATQAELRDDLARLITFDDYPARANREERGGIVRFRLLADITKPIGGDPANGYRPGECKIIQSSGHDDLDEETCKVVKRRFRFKSNSVDEVRTGVDGRVIWIPSWKTAMSWDPPEPVILTNFLFGDVSDKPLCWTDKVRREGTGFRVYVDQKKPNFNTGLSPSPEVRPEELSAGKVGSSFFLALGESVMISNNPHDACTMEVVQRDGRPAVKQHATFSWH